MKKFQLWVEQRPLLAVIGLGIVVVVMAVIMLVVVTVCEGPLHKLDQFITPKQTCDAPTSATVQV